MRDLSSGWRLGMGFGLLLLLIPVANTAIGVSRLEARTGAAHEWLRSNVSQISAGDEWKTF
jgi:hypothetical protein